MENAPVHSVWIPPLYRDLTNGAEIVEVSATSVGELIIRLDEEYPGIEARLCDEGNIRPNIAVSIDGEVTYRGVRQKLREPSEIHFVPALSGG
ncbi:MoaD/ThiS family protein [Chloroflexi bacterium TSY]|nr:MoaD/ThiS family protein [Chloroflexi bacterium TSY]